MEVLNTGYSYIMTKYHAKQLWLPILTIGDLVSIIIFKYNGYVIE